MKKEREPDLQLPDEAALEERVRKMMDVTLPDTPEAPKPLGVPEIQEEAVEAVPEPPKPSKVAVRIAKEEPLTEAEMEPKSSKPFVINVSHDTDDEPEATSAPQLPGAEVPKAETVPAPDPPKKSIAITHFSDEIVATEPLPESDQPPAIKPEPKPNKVPVKAAPAPKKVVVVADDIDDLPPTEDDSLLPTDMLTKTIETPKPKKAPKSKKVAITEEAERTEIVEPAPNIATVPVPVPGVAVKAATEEVKAEEPQAQPLLDLEKDSGDDLDALMAEAFPDSEAGDRSSTNTEDKFEELKEEPDAEPLAEVTQTAPLLPDLQEAITEEPTDEEKEAPTPPEKAAPKFDKFKPLTDIRPQSPEAIKRATLDLDSQATDQAVQEVILSESDKLLQVPEQLPNRPIGKPRAFRTAKPRQRQKVGPSRTRTLKKALLAVITVAVLAVAALPVTRFAALNLVGVRTSAELKILDQSTGQPLQNVEVSFGGNATKSDGSGVATFKSLKLGKAQLSVSRRNYAPLRTTVQLGVKANKPPAISMIPTGKQYSFTVSDYLSAKPVKAMVGSEFGGTTTDDSGVVKLTIDKDQTKSFEVSLSANGYRTEKLTIDPTGAKPATAVMVPARKYSYVSDRSGKLDVYSADLDGQNEQLTFKGSGNEQTKTTSLVPSQTDDRVALVSARTTAKKGVDQLTLTVIDLHDNSPSTVTEGAQIQIVDWVGERLIYAVIAADTPATETGRQRLMSYDTKTKKSQQLATANYFNNVLSAGGKIYYAPSSAYQPANSVGFFRINADGSGKLALLQAETWNVYRTSYDHLSLSVQQDWYDLKLGEDKAVKQNAAPTSLANTLYSTSPDGQHAVSVGENNGKVALALYDKSTGKDSALLLEEGLRYPLRWINDSTIVYRVIEGSETADYAYSVNGGSPKKVKDVVDVPGVVAWQIY